MLPYLWISKDLKFQVRHSSMFSSEESFEKTKEIYVKDFQIEIDDSELCFLCLATSASFSSASVKSVKGNTANINSVDLKI